MTSPRRARREEADDGGTTSGGLAGAANLRGALLIAVAVVIGVVLLGKGFDSGFLPSSSGDPSDDVAAGDGAEGEGEEGGDDESTTTAPPSTHVPAEVRVQVLNGGAPPGSAGSASSIVSAGGFVALSAADTEDVAASVVYAAPGYEADTQVIATSLGIAAPPQAMPTPPPTGAPADAHVVVVLGPDFAPPG